MQVRYQAAPHTDQGFNYNWSDKPELAETNETRLVGEREQIANFKQLTPQ